MAMDFSSNDREYGAFDSGGDHDSFDFGEQTVQRLPATFEGIISDFEAELGVGAWLVSIMTGDVFWSEGTYRIHDLAPSVPVGLESALSYYAAEDAERVRLVVEKAVQQQQDFTFEADIITDANRRKTIRSHGRYVERDGVPMLMGIIRLR